MKRKHFASEKKTEKAIKCYINSAVKNRTGFFALKQKPIPWAVKIAKDEFMVYFQIKLSNEQPACRNVACRYSFAFVKGRLIDETNAARLQHKSGTQRGWWRWWSLCLESRVLINTQWETIHLYFRLFGPAHSSTFAGYPKYNAT